MEQLRARGKAVVLALALAQRAAARGATAIDPSTPSPKGRALTISALPINFEPNRGQTPAPARFVARTGSVEIDLNAQGFDLWLAGEEGKRAGVNVNFLGARSDANLNASDEQASQTNYLLGRDPSRWRTHIPNFRRVAYRDLYSGIDAVFYGNGQKLEHDFIVAPGADYRLIRLRLTGARQASVDADGNLRLVLPDGELSFHRPVVYQNIAGERRVRKGSFVTFGSDEIGFEVGDYDHSQPLFIDPVLSYSTYLANLNIYVNAMAADAAGNTYVVGQTGDATYPVTPGAFQATCPACAANAYEVFVTKLNPSGSAQVFSTFLGGSRYNQPSGFAVNRQGNTVVVGWTESEDFPLKNPISNGTFNPGNNGTFGFVSSLSPDGSSLNYSSLLGGVGEQGSATTYTSAVALDASGNAYISGTTDSQFYPVTAGALNSGTPAYPENIVCVSKFSSTGSLVYSGLLGDESIQGGGEGPTGVMGIKVDASGNAYIAGDSGSLWPTTTGAYQPQFPASTSNTNKAPFVTEISADGSTLLYSTFLGVDASVSGLALDSKGDAFVAGYYAPSTFPTTPNAYEPTLSPGQTASYFSELNPSGSALLYSTFFSSAESIEGIALDASQDIWLAGGTGDAQFPLVNPLQSTPPQGYSTNRVGFLSEFDPTGTSLLFSTYFGPQDTNTNIAGLGLDASGNVYIAGTTGNDLYTTPGVYLGTLTPSAQDSGGTFGFVAAINPTVPSPALCIPYPVNLGINFGYIRTGTTISQTVTVQNCGTQSLAISSVTSSSPAYTIPAASNTCSSSVAPGGSCTLSVSFAPTQVQSYPAILSLASNAPIPTSLTLQGNGAVPVIAVAGSSVTFPPTLVWTLSPTVALTVGNGGMAPLIVNVAATTISPQFAFTTSGCSSPIYSWTSCVFTLTFNPVSTGNISGTLTIASNDPATPIYTVNLSGQGLATYPLPTITNISPQTAVVGGTGIVLSVYGQNFFPNSVITVNGEALATTYQDSTFLYTTLDPALLTSMAELPVTVTNPAPGGGTSAPLLLTTYVAIPMQISAMVYEPYSRLIFASIPSSATSNPNTVVAINPQTGAVEATISVGTNPGALAVSDDGQYLYLAANGQNAIQRINLTTLAVERTFALPVGSIGGNLQAQELSVVPGSPQMVVAVLIAPNASPDEEGIAAFNDSGLINWLPGFGAFSGEVVVDSFAFAGTPPVIYALPENTSCGGIFTELTVNSSGIQCAQVASPPDGTPSLSGNLVVSDGALLYTNGGQIWDPSAQSLLGTYSPAPTFTQAVIPDDSVGRTFFLSVFGPCSGDIGGVCAYDQSSLNQTGSLAFPAVSGADLAGLLRWGNNGFVMIMKSWDGTPSGNQFITLRSSSLTLPSSGTNPAPQLSALSTPMITPGGPNLLLGVTGGNFVRGAEVNWNGTPRTTTYQSATQLTAYISQADIASAGTAQVTVVNPAPGGGASSPLTAFIAAPTQLSINPTTLSFASQLVGASSAPSTVTITNTGTANLLVGAIAIGGTNGSDFSKTADSCSSATVNPNASCTVGVTFTPSAMGNRTAVLSIADNGTGSVQTVGLSGTGAAPSASASPANLTFTGQLVGTTSDAQLVTLNNSGNMALAVSKVAVSGDFNQTNNCGSSVAAGGTCTINITFAPKSGGSVTGSLTITDNNNGTAGSTQSITLSGTGMDFSVAAASGSSTTASVTPGQAATYKLALGGLGGLSEAINFTCTGAPSEATCSISPNPATPGTSATNITVSVTTTATSTLLPRALPPSFPTFPAPRGMLLLIFFLLCVATVTIARARVGSTRRSAPLLILAAGLLLTLLIAGCGGGGGSTPNNAGTPAGNYTLTVTGTTGSGAAALSHSVTVTLNVS